MHPCPLRQNCLLHLFSCCHSFDYYFILSLPSPLCTLDRAWCISVAKHLQKQHFLAFVKWVAAVQCQTSFPCNSHQPTHNDPVFSSPPHHLRDQKYATYSPLQMCPPASIQAKRDNCALLKHEQYQKELILQVFSASYLGTASQLAFSMSSTNAYVVTQGSTSMQ